MIARLQSVLPARAEPPATTDAHLSLPRAVWIWTAPPPEGRRVQIWVDAEDRPLPTTDDLEFAVLPLEVKTTPTLDDVALAALLVQCRP